MDDLGNQIRLGDVRGATATLRRLQESLLAHLKSEDEKLYIDLKSADPSGTGGMISVTVSTFSTAMRGISARADRFFKKYGDGAAISGDPKGLQSDFANLQADILRRIQSEETVLYPLYEKHCGG